MAKEEIFVKKRKQRIIAAVILLIYMITTGLDKLPDTRMLNVTAKTVASNDDQQTGEGSTDGSGGADTALSARAKEELERAEAQPASDPTAGTDDAEAAEAAENVEPDDTYTGENGVQAEQNAEGTQEQAVNGKENADTSGKEQASGTEDAQTSGNGHSSDQPAVEEQTGVPQAQGGVSVSANDDAQKAQADDQDEGVSFGGDTAAGDGLKADGQDAEETEEAEEALMGEDGDLTVEAEELDNAGAIAAGKLGSPSFGNTFEALAAANTKTFYIKTYQDWLNLAAISRENALEGYVFQINANNSVSSDYSQSNHYDLNQLMGNGFNGIGDEEHPFQGTLQCYSSNNLTLNCGAQPLFNCLGANARLENLKINCISSRSGVADYLLGGGTLGMKNVFVSGTISNKNIASVEGNAGGLFGVIDNQTDTPLTFDVRKEATTTQNGVAIGVSGNDRNNSTKLTIEGIYCGTIAGTVRGNVNFIYDPNTFSVAPTTVVNCRDNRGAAGMIFGRMVGDPANELRRPAFRLAGDQIFYPTLTTNQGAVGGVIGMGEYMTFDTQGNRLTIDGASAWKVSGNTNANPSVGYERGCGGVAGCLRNCVITAQTSLTVQNMGVYDNAYANGGNCGCMFGILYDTLIEGSGDGWQVTNCGASRGNVGAIAGKYHTTLGIASRLSNVICYNVRMMRECSNKSQGGLFGHVLFENASDSLTIENWETQGIRLNHNGNASSAPEDGTGGIAGKVESTVAGGVGGASLILKGGRRTSYYRTGVATTFTGTDYWRVWDSYGATGGIVGYLKNASLEIEDLYMKGLYCVSYMYNGGLVGRVEGNQGTRHIFVKNVEIPKYTTDNYDRFNYAWGNVNTYSGLLFGYVGPKTVVKLAGDLDFGQMTWNSPNARYMGRIAGAQQQALFYLEDGADYKPYTSLHDELGNYGGIYINKDWDSDTGATALIAGDVVQGTVKKGEDGRYRIKTVGDLLRLSIALSTEGALGMECFPQASYEDVLGADYVLEAATYDLSDTGMVSLQRNTGSGAEKTPACLMTDKPAKFTGSFVGQTSGGNTTTIIHKTSLYARQFQAGNPQYYGQNRQGLFINVGSGDAGDQVTFANLILQEDLGYRSQNEYRINATNAGGIATYASGNILVENCEITLDTNTMYHNSEIKGYYGGVFGRYDAESGTELTVRNVAAGGTKYVYDKDLYTSQVIGYINYPTNPAVKPVVTLKGITLSGMIQTKRTDTWYAIGGLVSGINNVNETGNGGYGNPYTGYTQRGSLIVEDVTVEGLSLEDTGASNKSGGFLGFRWTDVDVKMSGVTVTGDVSTVNTFKGSRICGVLVTEAAGRMDAKNINISRLNVAITNPTHVGMLVGEGRYLYLTLSDYKIDKDTVKVTCTDGRFDEIVGININDTNMNGNFTSQSSYENGGIVSIDLNSSSKALQLKTGDAVYNSYINQATYTNITDSATVNNAYTRYYYDLPEILEEAAEGKTQVLSDKIIDSAAELMNWHLLNYANTCLRPFFVLDSATNLSSMASTLTGYNYTIKGTIDLDGYSYYPTSIYGRTMTGADNATVVFHAQDMITGETAINGKRYCNNSGRQHAMMHAGLFMNVSAGKIRNLTLKGTVSHSNVGSGALVVGFIKGTGASAADVEKGYTYSTTAKTEITGIDLDDLWVARTADFNSYYGLMIRQIASGAKVEIDKIRMKNYGGEAKGGNTKGKAAAALIGLAGTANGETNEAAREIRIRITNVDLADLKDNVALPQAGVLDLSDADAKADKVLQYASLLYSYHYYEDTCDGVYLFYKSDYLTGKGITKASGDADPAVDAEHPEGSGYVTMGEEIGTEVEFFNDAYSNAIGSSYYDAYQFAANNYKPYVYDNKVRKLAVNPKPGNITEGSGTYEDPYIISNTKQLKSVYLYLKDKTEQLANWKVNAFKDDTSFSKDGNVAKTYPQDQDDGFPQREQMNQAYYMITAAEIDFSGFDDFVGFGTKATPFIGVFTGDPAGSNPVIKLPDKTTGDATLDSFALIRYAKGCVVRNLDIQLGGAAIEGSENKAYIKVSDVAGGVIAYVQGGDNIIDGVRVSGALQLSADSNVDHINKTAKVGGYVGCLQMGSLIIRGMTQESLKDFKVYKYSTKTETEPVSVPTPEEAEAGQYLWIGGVAGLVQDGALFCDGPDAAYAVYDQAGLTAANLYANDSGLIASPSFSPVNTKYLKAGVSADKLRIAVHEDGSVSDPKLNKEITVAASNGQQLWMAALALNSGCFTYEGTKQDKVTGKYQSGYDAVSRCRNGDYSKVGDPAMTEACSERLDVIKRDNLNGAQEVGGDFFHPYLFDFAEFVDASKESVLTGGLSTAESSSVGALLNGADSASKENYQNTAVRGAYHGAGALATAGNSNFGIVSDHFTIYLTQCTSDYDLAAFKNSFRGFGALYYTTVNRFKGNLIGTALSAGSKTTSTVRLDMTGNNVINMNNMGLINKVYMETQSDTCVVKDVTVSGTLISSTKYATDDASMEALMYQPEKTTALPWGTSSVTNRSVGGVIGELNIRYDIDPKDFDHESKANYYFENVNAKDLKILSMEYAGGLVGKFVLNRTNAYKNTVLRFKNCQTGVDDPSEADDTYGVHITAIADVGGLVAGYHERMNVSFEDCKVYSASLRTTGMNYFVHRSWGYSINKRPVAGGLIGRAEPKEAQTAYADTLSIKDCGVKKLKLMSIGHMGGAVGYNRARMTMDGFTGDNIYGVNTTTTEKGLDVSYDNWDVERYIGSFGGAIGYSSTDARTSLHNNQFDGSGNETDTNIYTKIYNVTLKHIRAEYTYGNYANYDSRTESKTNMAGLAGTLMNGAKLVNCHVTGIKLTVQDPVKANENLASYRFSGAGLVGRNEGMTCYNCSVKGESGWDTIEGTDSAAGLVAYFYGTNVTTHRSYYRNCSVEGVTLRANNRMGGIEANSVGSVPYSYFREVKVKDCKMVRTGSADTTSKIGYANYCSGGLVGCSMGIVSVAGEDALSSKPDTGATIENVVTSGIPSDKAGGLVGWCSNGNSQLQGKEIRVTGSTFIGRFAGGLAGYVNYNNTSSPNNRKQYENVEIRNNKIIAYLVTDDRDSYTDNIEAGGIYGYGSNSGNPFYADQVTLANNLIAGVRATANRRSYTRVGGLFGEMNNTVYLAKLTMQDNIISMLDHDKIKDDASGDKTRTDVCNRMADTEFSILDTGNVSANNVENRVYARMYKNTDTLEIYPDTNLKEADLPQYAKRLGLYAGWRVNYHAYLIDVHVTYSSGLEKYRPAADVADNSASTLNNLYDYRNYYHIIYNDYGNTTEANTERHTGIANVAAGPEWPENVKSKYSTLTRSSVYSFGQIEDIWSDYVKSKQNSPSADARYASHLEKNYGLQSNLNDADINSIRSMLKETYCEVITDEGAMTAGTNNKNYWSKLKDTSGDKIPMAVYDVQKDLNSWINTYINLVTGNFGAVNKSFGEAGLITVTPQKMKVDGGVVSYDPAGIPCVNVSGATNTATGLQFTVNSAGYDKVEDDTHGSFTMLHIEYKWSHPYNYYSYANNTNKQYIPLESGEQYSRLAQPACTVSVDIPIYVEKILEIDRHITGIEGAEYYMENIYQKSSGSLESTLQLLKGVYTAYIEYDYNDAVTDKSDTLTKDIRFVQANNKTVSIPIHKNTKMTLIDMTNDSRVYYFKAATDRTSVAFSEFIDSDGAGYVEQKLNTIPQKTDQSYTLYRKHYQQERPDGSGVSYNAGRAVYMQQYLLLIDSSEVEDDSGVSYTYEVLVDPAADNQDLLKKALYPRGSDCRLIVTEIKGIGAEFTTKTKVTGEIAEGSKGLHIDLDYEIQADEAYWDYIRMQEVKTEEFLDIAIYLKNAEDERINLPAGTTITFEKGTEASVTRPVDQSAISYFYKDSNREYSLLNVDGNRTISGTIDLNFDGADFSEFEEGTYTIYLELLKTKEKEFPMGGQRLGNVYEKDLITQTIRQLGFSLEAEDLMKLGMNGYLPQASDDGVIDYDMFIDFTDYVPKKITSNRTALEQLSDRYFIVKYEVQKKVRDAGGRLVYEPYTGDAVKLYWGKSSVSANSAGQADGTIHAFRFSENTIEKGNRGQNDSVVTFPYSLKVDVDQLLENNDSITNYKVVGHLYVTSDKPDGAGTLPDASLDQDGDCVLTAMPALSSGELESLKDYMVFTIAKIKTDLDVTGSQ